MYTQLITDSVVAYSNYVRQGTQNNVTDSNMNVFFFFFYKKRSNQT